MEPQTAERPAVDYDLVIVGAGPAGLSAAIRAKQLNSSLAVALLEKGSEVGAHILSGAVLDPSGLSALFPDWRQRGAPVNTPVHNDRFYFLSKRGAARIPSFIMPPLMSNEGNYIVSMGDLCRWMAQQATELGVEIYAGMSCSALSYGPSGEVDGVIAGEFGLGVDGLPGPSYDPGMLLRGKYVLLAEGARGSLSKQVITRFALDHHSDPQKFGLGFKEIWHVDAPEHRPGTVLHTLGWPLHPQANGGGFLYFAERGEVYLGLVVHLDYANPSLDPYMEFQRFKHHPMVAGILARGKRLSYGARAITEGGYQSMPQMVAPGVALLGCAVGLVNLPRIKGNHNAMLSGKAAAEAAVVAIGEGRQGDSLVSYENEVRQGAVGQDLWKVRNVKPLWSRLGLAGGLLLGGIDMWVNTVLGRSLFGTLRHRKTDAAATGEAVTHVALNYEKPDSILSFDRTTSVSFAFTNHDHGQPSHLKLKDPAVPVNINLPKYSEPAQRYCPAGVYEIERPIGGVPVFRINAQNCIHCKTCDIKDPSQNITWTTPQGGGGPNYPNM